jgi:plastocyanin
MAIAPLSAGCLGGGGGNGGDEDDDDVEDDRTPTEIAVDWVTASVTDAGHPGAANVDGADDIQDRTGQSETTVTNGGRVDGKFVFEPAIIRIDSGTTVTWQWISGPHTVTPLAELGATITDWNGTGETTHGEGFSHSESFETTGVVLYYCIPHLSQGQTGAILVE